jgi:hypothetical protein
MKSKQDPYGSDLALVRRELERWRRTRRRKGRIPEALWRSVHTIRHSARERARFM